MANVSTINPCAMMAKRAYIQAQKFTSERMADHYLAHCQELVTYSKLGKEYTQ